MKKHQKMKMSTSTKVSIGIFIAIIGIGGLLYLYRHTLLRSYEKATLPEPIAYTEVSERMALPTSAVVSQQPTIEQPAVTTTTPSASQGLPAEVNLAIPFTAQAPHGIWENPYKEYCEEASALMAISYIRHQTIPTPDFAAEAMNKIKDFEDARFGYYKDTTAAETAVIIREYFEYEGVQVVDNPTVDQIKQAVANGKPVIVPAAGRSLGNPHFTPPGPLYHMLVIKGYTKNGQFITNDPGTRFGADYLYPYDTLMNAIHDWRPDGQIDLGKKVMIVVG